LLKTAIVRKPGLNFAEGLTTFAGGAPDYQKAIVQHDAYCRALERCGLDVVLLEADLAHPDSTFVEDVAVATADFAVVTRPGAACRAGEVEGIREPLGRFFRVIHEIAAPGTLDGGDVCQAGRHFFIGISQRTNERGASELATILEREGYSTSLVDIDGMKNVLHLKSGVACVAEGKLVVCEQLAGREEFRGYELIRVAPEENYAANCVRVNDRLLIAAGFANFAAAIDQHGLATIALDVSEFQKMDGGLSCLSLRF
jgi:dimethylargininase